jgi:hypothetical protein
MKQRPFTNREVLVLMAGIIALGLLMVWIRLRVMPAQ